MCARYRLRRGWERDLAGYLRFFREKIDVEIEANPDDVRPTDRMPIIRADGDGHMLEMRRWGFVRMMRSASGRLFKKSLFNAKSETAPGLQTFRKAFCIEPLPDTR